VVTNKRLLINFLKLNWIWRYSSLGFMTELLCKQNVTSLTDWQAKGKAKKVTYTKTTTLFQNGFLEHPALD